MRSKHILADNSTQMVITEKAAQKLIGCQTYQIPNLSDTEFIYWTYLKLNLSVTELVGYQTYQIPNLSDTELILHKKLFLH
jgi:hypothetical protein